MVSLVEKIFLINKWNNLWDIPKWYIVQSIWNRGIVDKVRKEKEIRKAKKLQNHNEEEEGRSGWPMMVSSKLAATDGGRGVDQPCDGRWCGWRCFICLIGTGWVELLNGSAATDVGGGWACDKRLAGGGGVGWRDRRRLGGVRSGILAGQVCRLPAGRRASSAILLLIFYEFLSVLLLLLNLLQFISSNWLIGFICDVCVCLKLWWWRRVVGRGKRAARRGVEEQQQQRRGKLFLFCYFSS